VLAFFRFPDFGRRCAVSLARARMSKGDSFARARVTARHAKRVGICVMARAKPLTGSACGFLFFHQAAGHGRRLAGEMGAFRCASPIRGRGQLGARRSDRSCHRVPAANRQGLMAQRRSAPRAEITGWKSEVAVAEEERG
jgi:hypothetical protein